MNAKAAASRYQRQLQELSRQPGNDTCADCGGRNPRWASHNLGIFLCVQCAGVHRKMGTHISKVKSLTLDEWSKDQVERMRELGNTRSNTYYNPNEQRNRPPANVDDNERDNELERFIRNKYEYRRFMDRKPPPVPRKDPPSPMRGGAQRHLAVGGGSSNGASSPNRSVSGPAAVSSSNGSDIHRSRTAPIPATWKDAKRAASPLPALPQEDNKPSTSATAAISTPSISVSSHASSNTTTSNSSAFPTTYTQPSTSLSLPTPSLPQRASSAQGFGYGLQSQPSQMSQPAPPPADATSSFQGRSQVFDDLLSLGQPQQPQQPQQQIYGQMTNSGWPYQHQQQQPMMTGMNTGMGMNPWQQQQYSQPMLSPMQMGNMAFSPMQQQQMYPQQTAQASPNPFWQQHQQQQQQQYFGGAPQFQQQPTDVAQQYQQQRLQTGQVFDDWAKGMMPSVRR